MLNDDDKKKDLTPADEQSREETVGKDMPASDENESGSKGGQVSEEQYSDSTQEETPSSSDIGDLAEWENEE